MENLQIQQIAQRLRDLRLDEGKSIESMMEATDTTFEQYMNYEEGKSDFTFTFLHNCAKALGVDITVLISGEVPRLGTYAITRSGEGLPLERRQGFNYRHMAALFKSKLSEPFYVTARYNEQLDNSEIELSTHEGEEFDYILKGTMKARFGNHIEILHAGDSVYYNSGAPHGMIATGGKDCEFLAIVMKPRKAGERRNPSCRQGLTSRHYTSRMCRVLCWIVRIKMISAQSMMNLSKQLKTKMESL